MDAYKNFPMLAESQLRDIDYKITFSDLNHRVIIFTPHGGGIEAGTSLLVRSVAGYDLNFYLFEGIKKNGNSILHITSHHFDEPKCLELIAKSSIAVSIHGCQGPESKICIGGLDEELKHLLHQELIEKSLPSILDCPDFMATNPLNICNRNNFGQGVQLEISPDLRKQPYCDEIAKAVRSAIEAHSRFKT